MEFVISSFTTKPSRTTRSIFRVNGSALPGNPEAQIDGFVGHYDHRRYHESPKNLTPADVYCGRGQTILMESEKIKRRSIKSRRL
jgi:hypothetical protein